MGVALADHPLILMMPSESLLNMFVPPLQHKRCGLVPFAGELLLSHWITTLNYLTHSETVELELFPRLQGKPPSAVFSQLALAGPDFV